MEEERLEEL